MSKVKAALQAALNAAGLENMTPLLISRDVGVLLGGEDSVTEGETYNCICMKPVDDHELLVGTILGVRPFISGKNGARDLPPTLDIEFEGVKYSFWLNTIEGMYMAAVRSVPFLSLGLDDVVFIDEHATEFVEAIRKLVSTDKSSYLNQSLSAIGNIMSLQTIDPLKVCMIGWTTLQVMNHENFKAMTAAEFNEVINAEPGENESLNTLVEFVKSARLGQSVGMTANPAEAPKPNALDRIAFANAIGKLTEDYVANHARIAQETSEDAVIAAATNAERLACELVKLHQPKINAAWKAFID